MNLIGQSDSDLGTVGTNSAQTSAGFGKYGKGLQNFLGNHGDKGDKQEFSGNDLGVLIDTL